LGKDKDTVQSNLVEADQVHLHGYSADLTKCVHELSAGFCPRLTYGWVVEPSPWSQPRPIDRICRRVFKSAAV